MSLQVAGTVSSCLSYCSTSLPLISSRHGSACAASGTPRAPVSSAAATAPGISFMGTPRSVGDAQSLVHHWAGGGVLQELLLLRVEVVLDGERRERRLVKSREDQLLLARVGVD